MRKLIPHLLLCLLIPAAGCGKGSQAASRKPPPPAPAAPTSRPGPPIVESPDDNAARSMPGLDGLSKGAEVRVRSVEAVRSPLLSGIEVSCLLEVRSFQASPRLRVEPRRFWIEGKTIKVQARQATGKDLVLPSAYLKAGESVSGWLAFEVPEGARDIILKSDLQSPPIEVPIALPGG